MQTWSLGTDSTLALASRKTKENMKTKMDINNNYKLSSYNTENISSVQYKDQAVKAQ
jgi:hypothetical protein